MKKLIMHLAKKYAVKAVNDLLGTHTDDVRRISSVVDVWTTRLSKITERAERKHMKSLNRCFGRMWWA